MSKNEDANKIIFDNDTFDKMMDLLKKIDTSPKPDFPPVKLEGPWLNEPNEVDGTYRGIAWEIRRNGLGALCGYIKIPLDIQKKLGPEFISNIELNKNISVHGGVTYTDLDTETSVLTIGFDCAHYDDVTPLLPKSAGIIGQTATYKTIDFVTKEITNAIDQILTATYTDEYSKSIEFPETSFISVTIEIPKKKIKKTRFSILK